MALTLDDTQSAVLLASLGLPEDTDDLALILDTVRDAATPPAEPDLDDQQQPDGQLVAAAKPSDIAAAAAKHGMEVIDTATAESLRRDAAEGRRIAAAARKAEVERAVDDAVDHGKITASRRQHWVTLIENDEHMADVLAGIPAETAVPLSEVGHCADTTRDDLAGQWFY